MNKHIRLRGKHVRIHHHRVNHHHGIGFGLKHHKHESNIEILKNELKKVHIGPIKKSKYLKF